MRHQSFVPLSSSIKSLLPLVLLLLAASRVSAATEEVELFSPTEKWLYGILTGVGLGLIGLICAGIVVYLKKFTVIDYTMSLKILVAFAAGALIGDAVVHMIPEAFEVHHEEGTEEAEVKPVPPKLLSFFICLGIFVFTLLERLFHLIGIGHTHGPAGHVHDSESPRKEKKLEIDRVPTVACLNHENEVINIKEGKDINQEGDEQTIKGSAQSLQPEMTKGWRNKKPEAFLNQMGDFLHNIMDGIALGVAFSSTNRSTVVSTIIAIFAHEIPQEMGNASILINSNFSAAQAMMCNGLVNFSAIIGIIIGLIVSELNENADKIMKCFIAGNFLFIGATEMLPKLSGEKSTKHAFYQLIGLAVGFGIMFLVTLLEPEEH